MRLISVPAPSLTEQMATATPSTARGRTLLRHCLGMTLQQILGVCTTRVTSVFISHDPAPHYRAMSVCASLITTALLRRHRNQRGTFPRMHQHRHALRTTPTRWRCRTQSLCRHIRLRTTACTISPTRWRCRIHGRCRSATIRTLPTIQSAHSHRWCRTRSKVHMHFHQQVHMYFHHRITLHQRLLVCDILFSNINLYYTRFSSVLFISTN